MRHKIAGNRLNRFSSWRKATVRDLAKATLIKQRICTTKAKAKEARKLVDNLITIGKEATLAAKRKAFAILCDHSLVSDLFNKITPRFKNRVGGYTRIIPAGYRRGDNAIMVFLELTEKEEVVISKPKTKKIKKSEQPSPVADKIDDKKEAHKEEKKPVEEHKHHIEKRDTKSEAISAKDKAAAQQGKFMGGIRKIFNKKSSGK